VELPLSGETACWSQQLSTENPTFCSDPLPIDLTLSAGSGRVRFERPGAIVLGRRSAD